MDRIAPGQKGSTPRNEVQKLHLEKAAGTALGDGRKARSEDVSQMLDKSTLAPSILYSS